MTTKRGGTGAKTSDDKPISRWIGLGVGAGIGSAAIAAALIYANRTRKTPETPKGPKEEEG
jgi:hypothetical protein